MDQTFAMRLFVHVVNDGSFSKAGPRMGITQSAASRRIAALEADLGAQLLHRSTRRLALTEAGRIFHTHAESIIAQVDDARRAVANLTEAPNGVLRVTAPATFGRRHIVPLISNFQRTYPGVELGLALSDSVDDLIGRGYDLAVRIGRLRDTSLIAKRIATSRSMVCAHANYLANNSPPKHPDDLTHHNCLTFRAHPGRNTWRFKNATTSSTSTVRVSGSFYADNGDALLSAALSGLGIVMLPHWLVATAVVDGDLKLLLPDYTIEPEHTPIQAVYAETRHVAPKVRAFIDFLEARFKYQNW